jgi:hypothetical protein
MHGFWPFWQPFAMYVQVCPYIFIVETFSLALAVQCLVEKPRFIFCLHCVLFFCSTIMVTVKISPFRGGMESIISVRVKLFHTFLLLPQLN